MEFRILGPVEARADGGPIDLGRRKQRALLAALLLRAGAAIPREALVDALWGEVHPGAKTGQGRVEGTVPMVFSADETCDMGSDTASPVSDDYTSETSRFTGKVEWVQIDIDDAAEDLDHLISPEERLHIAMARQ
jgi:hypothetical protein